MPDNPKLALSSFFVTGTDTEVGKTHCSTLLLAALQRLGYVALGYKPVASGSVWHNNRWENEDALALQQASSLALAYEMHNQYSFAEATAPHFLAGDEGIDLSRLSLGLSALQAQAQMVLVEGAGGWFTPLAEQVDFVDWVVTEQLPIVLVVGMKLGSINHALLTVKAIEESGLPFLGWIGNFVNPPHHRDADYLQSLKRRINAPCLAIVPHGQNHVEQAISQLCTTLPAVL